MSDTIDIAINPLSAHTGAEILNVDLSRPVDAPLRQKLNDAFIKHTVLAIRGQKLDPHQFLAAAKLFGTIFPQHNSRFSVPECPEIHYISNQDTFEDGKVYIPGEGYHTDHSNDAQPPKATVLHAVKLPKTGGDTQFVNMYEAYDALSQTMKARIDNLQAVHVYQSSLSTRKLMALKDETKTKATTEVIHPLVRTHPISGRKAIYINPIRIERLIGLEREETSALLDELLEHSTQDRFQYRHKWHEGDMVIWDNRCLMHKANGDYPVSEVRYLYRLMLKGGTPA
ncbi:MAG TPA: TauD/TfdA family dioxygenase [Beijerinckiaceae bacterium]|jgi:taurine dioxygenase|nr:TauD/TfdA family dioxygenase [Beijerinckiaceae bacterium]